MSFDKPEPRSAPLRGDIAIVGMGCVFAGASDLDAYWQNILAKHDAISDPPGNEWDPKIFYDPSSKANDRVYCKRGGYIGDLAKFQPSEFGVMPVTVDGGEPDQWLALRVAHEALADAGYTAPPSEHVRTEVILGKGTYVNRGNLTVGYHGMIVEHFLRALKNLHPEYTDDEINDIKKELKAGLPPFSADTAPALIGNIIAGRIANRLDFMGPSFTVDAACASALLAIEIGVGDLLSRKCDLVLAGGANVNAPLPTLSLFCQLGALSRNERIKPFDATADGTILGEGLGMIVLKRREDAERAGDRIYALIKGVGLASDGRAVHVMAPRIEGEELALRRAYEMADVSPETVGLIEAHGTATPVGDVVEVQALARLFGERRGPLPTCAIGSVKSMIGHTMPAAGIAGVIKAALSLYHRVLPPTLNCEEPNPALHLEKTPFYVNTETRPWVQAASTPRRAGVNSFGFGGINAHVVLEEHVTDEDQLQSHQLQWDSEICILEAESRGPLMENAARLVEYIQGASGTPLKDLAYSLNSWLTGQPTRLAVVATSNEDLAAKLQVALRRLGDPKCRQIKDNSGIYFFDQPLNGKVAFLFPGEGAQYPNMLLDLCVHFPEVRKCFDLADRALLHGSRNILPSDVIFPRSILSASERADVEKALWQIDGAVEGVLIANWALWTLLRKLDIQPDMILGHSTGDYTAMLASNIIQVAGEGYVETIVGWNKAHSRIAETAPVPDATLVAVAGDSKQVQSIIEAVGGDLYIAMDNCPHQTVLVGSKECAAQAVELLRSRGLIYEILPFDRPYHTPMFEAYARGAGDEFFSRLPLAAPSIETYSCTTAAPYPSSVDEIRELFVAHWVQPVLFTQTIERAYEDGVRIFVEAGPRGNLTAFVSDILRGKPHLAMPANVARRSGILQLNHLLGVLAAQGVAMRTDYLYARRNPKQVDWENPQPVSTKPAPMTLSLALPPLTVAPRTRKPEVPLPMSAAKVAPSKPLQAATAAAGASASLRTQPALRAGASATALASRPSQATAVMENYWKGMESFLDTETQVMHAFLKRMGAPAPQRPLPSYPLLGTITSITPGLKLTAIRKLHRNEDLFLKDHALGGPISITDPDLRPMVVVPMTMSMEILAEAGAALMPGKLLVGMRDVQANHWIRVDDTEVELQISAEVRPRGEVRVQVLNAADVPQGRSTPVIEGIMLFADRYPARPASRNTAAFQDERRSRLASAELYDGRLMFHGPRFQGVASVDRSGSDGLIGQLRVLPTGDLFRSTPHPAFVYDPVVLDAAGQMVGFWAAEYLERGFVVFPYRLDRLHIYGPNRAPNERLTCRVDLQLKGNDGIRSDIEIAAPDGTLWMQMEGWADRRFDPPEGFHRAWTDPHKETLSQRWEPQFLPGSGRRGIECFRLEKQTELGRGLWNELWPTLVLNQRERTTAAERRGPEHRQIDWLSGRTAAKDAVRTYLRKHHNLNLLPADIEITQDVHGRPKASGAWTHHVPSIPELSMSHTLGMAVAIAGDSSLGQRYGIDVQGIRELAPDFESLVLNADEQKLLNEIDGRLRLEWLTRIWCAKEAVSKALGRGLIEGPVSVRVRALDPATGMVTAAPWGKLADAVPGVTTEDLATYTERQGDFVIAISIYQRRTI